MCTQCYSQYAEYSITSKSFPQVPLQSVPTLLDLSNHWSYFGPCSFAFAQMSHKWDYVATALCAWLLLTVTGSLSVQGLPFLEAFLKKPDHLFQFPTVWILLIVSHRRLLVKSHKRAHVPVTCIWGFTLDRRSRKARSQGYWHRF